MKRKIIEINEELCNGCGLCIPNCQEGALQIIDGKARLISDLFCDGLGACIGHCPEGAIEIIEREAEPYNEKKVMEILVTKGKNTILAHMEHLRDHNEQEYLKEAIDFIKENNIDMSEKNIEQNNPPQIHSGGCPGSRTMDFNLKEPAIVATPGNIVFPADIPSELKQWPVQLHLLNSQASYFRNADVVLAADCAAFAMGNFHSRYLKGKSLAIACPKLDTNTESYLEKLTSMIADAKINSLTVVIMEVPCCSGLLQMALSARENAKRNIPIKQAVISIQGEVLEEEWA
jgi:NAD-dependent dihydropyrimidine dehydrogenase PreA subunit